jgi:hypothetical protein
VRHRFAELLFGLAIITSCQPASSQTVYSPGERFFKIDWHVERHEGQDVAIVGRLRNDYLYSLERIQLQIQVLDDVGRVTGEFFGALGNRVPPGGSTTFRLLVGSAGAQYAVLVHAFEFGEMQSPP